tara:strand:- start:1304 stop:1840 length:537 start_codon:yes stop_codon:yes gene_type:complete
MANHQHDLKYLILDVDGVMTTGKFFYDASGKVYKEFGADDNDALRIASSFFDVFFVTGDKKGFQISKKRIVDDMGYPLELVSTMRRIEWIKNKFQLEKVVYMGDGIFDHYVMQEVAYSIAPSNAHENALKAASYITARCGGDRAVAEACEHLLNRFVNNWSGDYLEVLNKADSERIGQ